MKHAPSLLGLVLLALLPACNGTSLRERMDLATGTMHGMLDRAQDELDVVEADFEAAPIPPAAQELLRTMAGSIERDLEAARADVRVAALNLNTAAIENARQRIDTAYREIASLRTATIVAEVAANGAR
jgi:hypothetical protein